MFGSLFDLEREFELSREKGEMDSGGFRLRASLDFAFFGEVGGFCSGTFANAEAGSD